MTTLADSFHIDAINVIADAPIEFTWNGGTYIGTKGGLVLREPLQTGGFLEIPDLTISTSLMKKESSGVMVSRFVSDIWPDVGDLVTVDSVVYRVEQRTIDEFETMIQLDLRSRHA